MPKKAQVNGSQEANVTASPSECPACGKEEDVKT